jgi:hypothetical protein
MQMRKVIDTKEVRPLRLLPNIAGFEFHGVRADFTLANCRVERTEEGTHVIRGEESYFNLQGWVPKS